MSSPRHAVGCCEQQQAGTRLSPLWSWPDSSHQADPPPVISGSASLQRHQAPHKLAPRPHRPACLHPEHDSRHAICQAEWRSQHSVMLLHLCCNTASGILLPCSGTYDKLTTRTRLATEAPVPAGPAPRRTAPVAETTDARPDGWTTCQADQRAAAARKRPPSGRTSIPPSSAAAPDRATAVRQLGPNVHMSLCRIARIPGHGLPAGPGSRVPLASSWEYPVPVAPPET